MAHMDPARTYRLSASKCAEEQSFQLVVGETDLHVVTAGCGTLDIPSVLGQEVRRLRGHVASYGQLHAEFAESLTPVAVESDAPEIIQLMAEAAKRFGVGPMAAVAGTVAQLAGQALLRAGCTDVLVENGGDCWLHSTRERVVGLLPDPAAGARLGLRIPAADFPLGICASSGRIGHSLSFGAGDVVVVRSGDQRGGTPVADAAATALANRLRDKGDIQRVLGTAASWADQGVDGVFLHIGGHMAAWGEIELVAL